MPESLLTPETRPEGGVDDVDVMNFLGLKRAPSLESHHDSKEKES